MQAEPLELAFERHKRLSSVIMGWVAALVVIFIAYQVTDTGTKYDYLNLVMAVIAFFVVGVFSYEPIKPWCIPNPRSFKMVQQATSGFHTPKAVTYHEPTAT